MTWQSSGMTDIGVRLLEADEWATYREVRLSALADAPQAFTATEDEERAFDEQVWRDRMIRSTRMVAERDEQVVGVASVGDQRDQDDPRRAELFGLWVVPDMRGHGVAAALVRAGMETAYRNGRTHLSYWVSTENGRAVAFASGFGFLPTDSRRPMVGASHAGEQEIMMMLPLSPDRGNPTLLPPSQV